MEAASECPKCGIELTAEIGSRCPLCGTGLQVRGATLSSTPVDPATRTTDPSGSPTDPATPVTDPALQATNPSIAAVIPGDPDAATTRGWSIDVPPPQTGLTPLPAPSAPFTPMPALVPSVVSLPPPPFAAGAAARGAPVAAPLPGPPVLARSGAMSPFANPDDDITGVAPDPRLLPPPTPRPDPDEPVPASSLEYDRPPPALPAPPPPSPWGSTKPPSASPLPEVPTLSPTRVAAGTSRVNAVVAPPAGLRPARPSEEPAARPKAEPVRVEPPPPPPPARVEPPASPTPRVEQAAPPAARMATPSPSRSGAAFGSESTVPTARAVPASARMFSQSMPAAPAKAPRARVRGVFLFLLAVAGMATAFAAGRYTAPRGEAVAATPVFPAPTAASPSRTEPSPEETAAAAKPDDAVTPQPTARKSPVPAPTRVRRARADRSSAVSP